MKNKTRTILLPPKLCRLLKDYCKQEKITSGMIFITRRGNPVDRSNILHEMKNLCGTAGVEREKVLHIWQIYCDIQVSTQREFIRWEVERRK